METQKHFKYVMLLLILFFSEGMHSQNTDWNQDLKVYASQLEEKHIDVYNTISKKKFQKEISRIQMLSETTSDFKVIVELMKLTRQIGDGHTAVSLRNFETHRFPFEIKLIDNEWRIVKISKPHEKLLKSSLVAIDGIPINEVIEKVSEVAQFVENEYSQVIRTANYTTISELLYALSITKKKNLAEFTFLDEKHQKTKVILEALNEELISNDTEFASIHISVPEITKPKNSMFSYLWYAPVEGTKAVYIQFNSYPSFEDMQLFGEDLVGYISHNNIQQVIIDMRNNGGGDLYVGVVLAYALNLADSIDWKHGVYAMTSGKTFSAATSNTALYKNLLNARIVGQPSGSNPTGYQDMDQFELPNSKLVITYSKRLFRLSDTKTQGVVPDIVVKYHWSDYAQGNDTILQWVLNDIKKND